MRDAAVSSEGKTCASAVSITNQGLFVNAVILFPCTHRKSLFHSLPRRRPASPRILIQHASPEDDRYRLWICSQLPVRVSPVRLCLRVECNWRRSFDRVSVKASAKRLCDFILYRKKYEQTLFTTDLHSFYSFRVLFVHIKGNRMLLHELKRGNRTRFTLKSSASSLSPL